LKRTSTGQCLHAHPNAQGSEAHLGLGPLGRHLDFRAKTKYLGVESGSSANTRSISISTASYSDKDVADAMGIIVLGNSTNLQNCAALQHFLLLFPERGTDRHRQASPLCPPWHPFQRGLDWPLSRVTARQRAGSEAQPTNQPTNQPTTTPRSTAHTARPSLIPKSKAAQTAHTPHLHRQTSQNLGG
jgi:hypothetical protein